MSEDRTKGYGPRARLMFDGDERKFEIWQVKFLAFLRIQKLHTVLDGGDDAEDESKNAEIFAELVQVLDDRSLSLIMREAVDDGKKAIQILREHYQPKGKPRVITLYTELTSMCKRQSESITDYIIRAETTAASLRDTGEAISDSLLIAMLLKGLPQDYKPFVTVVNQKEKAITFSEFKTLIRNYEDTEKVNQQNENSSVMNFSQRRGQGHPKTSNMKNMQSQENTQNGNQKSRWCTNCKSNTHDTNYCRKLNSSGAKPQAKHRWCDICRSKTHDTKFCRKLTQVREAKLTSDKDQEQDPSDEHYYAFILNENQKIDQAAGVSTFLVDSGATVHIVNDKSKFVCFHKNFDSHSHIIELADGTRLNNIAEGRGDAKVTFTDHRGTKRNITLYDALYVPAFSQNIFSVQAAAENGATITFSEDSASLSSKGNSFPLTKKGKLYYISECKHTDNSEDKPKQVSHTLQEWHEIMGHCNCDDLMKLENLVQGMKIVDKDKKFHCEVCVLGKMSDNRSRKPDKSAKHPFDCVHVDLAGPIDPEDRNGMKYALICIDKYSNLTSVYFIKQKSDAASAFKQYLSDIAPFGTVKAVRSDQGGEFLSKEFGSLLTDNKIKHEKTCPYSPHQNGKAERAWRSLFDMSRCLLLQSGLPKTMWTYAVRASAYIRNRCFNKNIEATPFETATGIKPNIANMKTFGSTCYALKQNPKKLEDRSEKGIFVGYERNSPAFLVYFPESNTVRAVRCVKFTNSSLETKKENEITNDDDDEMFLPIRRDNSSVEETVQGTPDEDENQSNDPSEGNENTSQSQSTNQSPSLSNENVTGTGRPQRVSKMPKYLQDDYVVGNDLTDDLLNNVCIHYCFNMSILPTTYKEAMSSKEADKWQKAMNDEMSALGENETFELTTLPPDRKAVGGKWVYTVKSGPNGEQQHKARYVAKGYSQIQDIDYQETFSPTARMTSIRTLVHLAVQNDWEVHQMDVKAAFLNAPIDVELYVEQPEGYEVKSKSGKKLVLKLNKSLYGLKQSGRNWNTKLHEQLLEQGFAQSRVDPCVYTKDLNQPTGDQAVIVVWVDDILIAASNASFMKAIKVKMNLTFKMKDLGKVSWFLGIQFLHDPRDGSITMSQSQYIEKLLLKFGMHDCKPKYTPCDVNLNKFCDEPAEPADEKMYKEMVGSLIYLMTATRPDLCYIVTRLSQYMARPTLNHMIAAKHVLRYLKATIGQTLIYRKSETPMKLVGACDADWGNLADRKSITGYCFMISDKGPCISWKSKKQQTVALSTCEAEYMSMCAATQEGIFLKALIKDMKPGTSDTESFTLMCDNQGAIALSKNPVSHQRSKHIDIRYHFVRDQVQNGTMNIVYLPTDQNWSDMFTKPVSRTKLQMFKPTLMGE